MNIIISGAPYNLTKGEADACHYPFAPKVDTGNLGCCRLRDVAEPPIFIGIYSVNVIGSLPSAFAGEYKLPPDNKRR